MGVSGFSVTPQNNRLGWIDIARDEARNRTRSLLLHTDSEACSRADFLHADFLEPDALKAGAFKRPETAA
jgi:hypothetical protein